MAATTTFINDMLDSAFTGALTIHLYTVGTPSTTGVEVTGGSYSAQTLTLGAAAAKKKATSSNVVFTDLPGSTIVAWGVKQGGTLIDEGTLSSPYTADVTNNTLELSYTFDLSGS